MLVIGTEKDSVGLWAKVFVVPKVWAAVPVSVLVGILGQSARGANAVCAISRFVFAAFPPYRSYEYDHMQLAHAPLPLAR